MIGPVLVVPVVVVDVVPVVVEVVGAVDAVGFSGVQPSSSGELQAARRRTGRAKRMVKEYHKGAGGRSLQLQLGAGVA